jgi:hypothetical protein
MPPVIGPREAAVILGRGPETVIRYVETGRLPLLSRNAAGHRKLWHSDVLALAGVPKADPTAEAIAERVAELLASAPPLSNAVKARPHALLASAA